MKRVLARFLLFFGLCLILLWGFDPQNAYNMVYRLLGVLVAFIGMLSLLYSGRKQPNTVRMLRKKSAHRFKIHKKKKLKKGPAVE